MDSLASIVRCVVALGLIGTVSAASSEVLLLKHGGLLDGQIAEDEASYVVRGQGQEFRISKSRVAGRFASGQAAYEWLSAKLEAAGPSTETRLKLAEWCLQNELSQAAQQQLGVVGRTEPGHPRLALLRARLAQINEPIRPVEATPRLRPTPRGVQQASFEAAEPPRLVVPPGELSEFTRGMQPLLVNNCTTSGCHQPTSEGGPSPHGFTLDRSLLHGYADARSTEANLRSVLRLIDTASPDESPLIQAAVGPHAGVQPFKGTRRDEWLARLSDWVHRVVDANATGTPDNQPIRDEAVAPASYDATEDPQAPAIVPQTHNRPAESSMPETSAAEYQPRDEFDPELFNRRYGDATTTPDAVPGEASE